MKLILVLLALFIPLHTFGAATTDKKPEQKPMKVFVEIEGKLYEVLIHKSKDKVKDRATVSIEENFRDQARKFGVEYLRNRLILIEKK